MTTRVSVVLSGIGGYGGQYLDALLDPASQDRVELVGAVDPFPERCARLAELRARGVPVFPSLQAFYAQASAELAIISAPIHEHCPQTCLALEHGSHVLCEKPLAATVQDADRMIEARDRAGRQAAIGYQWSFCPAILDLKRDILAGRFGQARRLTTVVLWPRTQDYYRRNAWAGRQKSVDGAWVLDSPVNNAAAHYLHNMLFVLGEAVDRSAGLDRAQAELYRANPIENYDTAALRCFTDGGAEVLFYTSHAVSENVGPQFVFEFERGVVRLDGLDGVINATLEDGAAHRLWRARSRRAPQAVGRRRCCRERRARAVRYRGGSLPDGLHERRAGVDGAHRDI